MAKEPSRWNLACDRLRAHVRRGESCEQAINRLWTRDGSELRPWISKVAVDIHFEYWKRERLATLGGSDEAIPDAPGDAVGPPVVVRWRGRDYLLEGHRQIDQLDKQGAPGPYEVIILDIGNMAGDF